MSPTVNSFLNDVLRIVTGCLRLTSMDHLHILLSIQSVELQRLETVLLLIYRGSVDPHRMFSDHLSGSLDALEDKLRSRYRFVSAAGNLLNNLAELGIRASQRTNYRWNTEYCENTSRLRTFIPMISTRPVGMSLLRTA